MLLESTDDSEKVAKVAPMAFAAGPSDGAGPLAESRRVNGTIVARERVVILQRVTCRHARRWTARPERLVLHLP